MQHSFFFPETVKAFTAIAEKEPSCAMAYWGIAHASGSNYNKRWEAFAEEELQEALAVALRATEAALARLDRSTPVEQALIRALEQRYQSALAQSTDALCAWNDAYAASMRSVYATFSNDLDVSALFAEAMINRTP